MTRPLAQGLLAVGIAVSAATAGTCSNSRSQDAGTLDARSDASAGTADAITDATIGTADAIIDATIETADAIIDATIGTADAITEDATCAPGCQVGVQAGCDDDVACVRRCQQDFAKRICNPEKSAAQRCVIAIGPDAITCMNGRPYVKSEVCQNERQALTGCLLGAPDAAARD